MLRPCVLCVCFTAAAACGGDDDPGPGPDPDAGPEAGDAPTVPAAPEPPRLLPCPEGWREVPDRAIDGLVTCDPWPPSGPADCEGGEVHFPGRPGCEPIGAPCPAGDFAEGLPADGVRFVRAGEPSGGDGTRERPFGRIADALEGAADGTVIALSKGTFDEALTLARPLTLWGACVEETVVTTSRADDALPVVEISLRGGATLRDLQVTGPRQGVVAYGNEDACLLDSVLVRETVGIGVGAAAAGRIEARRLVVRDTIPLGDDFGHGVELRGGSVVVLETVAIERAASAGILAYEDETLVRATDLAVRDTRARADGDFGYGIALWAGGDAEVTRAAIERARTVGVLAYGVGTTLVATDLVVRGTSPRGDGDLGDGIDVHTGGRAELSRVLFAANRNTALFVQHAGTEAVLQDVVVLETRAREAGGDYGYAAEVLDGARLDVARAVLARNLGAGVLVAAPGSTLAAADLVVRDTESIDATGEFGMGVVAQHGARATLERTVLLGNRRAGAVAVGGSASVQAEDLVVDDTRPQACASAGCPGEGGGAGLAATGGALSATRFRVSGSALCGVQVALEGEMDLADGEVSRNPIGANVQIDAYDLSRLERDVDFLDNTRELDGSALSLPVPIDPTER